MLQAFSTQYLRVVLFFFCYFQSVCTYSVYFEEVAGLQAVIYFLTDSVFGSLVQIPPRRSE